MRTKAIVPNKSHLTKEQRKAAKAFRDGRKNQRGRAWLLAKEA